MLRTVISLFMIAHGAIYLFYFGHARRLFELTEALVWPDDSWILSKLLNVNTIRWLASIFCVVAAVGFVAGGVGLLANQTWWRSIVQGVAVFSIVMVLLFWDGTLRRLPDQGFIGILINIALVVITLTAFLPAN